MATANEVVASSFDEFNWTETPVDLSSTDGIQRAIKANTLAIRALANHIDGVKPGDKPVVVVPEDTKAGKKH